MFAPLLWRDSHGFAGKPQPGTPISREFDENECRAAGDPLSEKLGFRSGVGSDVIRPAARGRSTMVMMRRRHLAATTHQMATVPNALAHNAWMRFGSGRRERHDKHGEQDE